MRRRLVLAVLVLACALAGAPGAFAAPSDLFFSEYIEGSSNNKALEIFNGTGASVILAAQGYNVQMYFNGSAAAGLTIDLTGTVAAGDVYVVAQSAAGAAILAQADQTNAAGWFNGDDAVVLRKGTTILDVIGQIGVDPGTEWGTRAHEHRRQHAPPQGERRGRRCERRRCLRPVRRVGRLRHRHVRRPRDACGDRSRRRRAVRREHDSRERRGRRLP